MGYEIRSNPGVNTVVYQSTTGQFATVAQALEHAWQSDTTGTITFDAPGTYDFGSSYATLSRPRRTLVIPNTVTLTCGSGTYGIALISGNFITVTGGGRIVTYLAVNDQVGISVTGNGCMVKDISFEVTTSAGSSSNPMTLLGGSGANRLRVEDVDMFPEAGVRMLQLLNCEAPSVVNFYGGPITGTTARACWRGIDIDGGSRVNLRDVRLSYLGSTAAPLDHVIRAYENDYESGGQDGDRYFNLDIDTVACRHMLHLIGRKGVQVAHSRFRAGNTSVSNTNNYVDRFDAAILIDNVDETAVADADNKYAAHIQIIACEFDGAAGMGASDIYVRSCAKAEIENTRHVHSTSRFAVTIDADHCIDVSVRGCYFDGQYNASLRPTQYQPILVINRLAEDESGETADSGQNGGQALWEEIENVTISDCLAEGYLLTLPALSGGTGIFPPTRGVRGSYFPFGLDGFDGYIASTAIGTTASTTVAAAAATPSGGVAITSGTTITRSAGSWLAEGYKVGMTFTIASAEDAGNDGDWTVATVSATVLTVASGLTNNAADTTATFQPHLFEDLLIGDYFMLMGHTDEENWGVRIIQANTGPSLTVTNPTFSNNCDPTIEGTALSSGGGSFTSVAFGDGTGVITRTGGSDWSGTLKPGMFLTVDATLAANDVTTPAMITASTSTTVTLQGVTFTSASGDTGAVLTPSNGGWGLTTEAAGDSVEMFVFKRATSEINFSRPLSTNIAGRRIR